MFIEILLKDIFTVIYFKAAQQNQYLSENGDIVTTEQTVGISYSDIWELICHNEGKITVYLTTNSVLFFIIVIWSFFSIIYFLHLVQVLFYLNISTNTFAFKI